MDWDLIFRVLVLVVTITVDVIVVLWLFRYLFGKNRKKRKPLVCKASENSSDTTDSL
jgi:heme/copper-type cytochrome/quinol oxidase subunit 2